MSIKIGDYVAFDFRKHCLVNSASIGLVMQKTIIKGYVDSIKTHDFLIFKRSKPIYKVNGVWVENVKPIKRAYASLMHVYPSGSIWEYIVN